MPFNLDQTHVAEGDPSVWDEPDRYLGLLATAAGVVVRDRFPDQFLSTTGRLFEARHDRRACDLRRRPVLVEVLDQSGVDGAGRPGRH